MIQGGAILEASAAVHICHEVEAAVKVIAIVAGAERSLWLQWCSMIWYVFLVTSKNLLSVHFCSLSPKAKYSRRSLSLSRFRSRSRSPNSSPRPHKSCSPSQSPRSPS